MESPSTSSFDALIASHKPGYALAQPFYNNPEIFRRDIQRIFTRYWSFAGHVSRIKNPGDYFLFTIGDESIIVIRGKDGQVHALFNVCRHRGSRLCLESEGNSKAIVCPYHAWTYATDGTLTSAPAMLDGFDASQFALRKCAVRIVEGMIFVRLADDQHDREGSRSSDLAACGFADQTVRVAGSAKPQAAKTMLSDAGHSSAALHADVAFTDLERFFKPHRLAGAKIAASVVWQVEANWKLVVENFGECYHCRPTHPEYCSVMAHATPDSYKTPRAVEEFAKFKGEWEPRAQAMGLPIGNVEGPLHYIGRVPIREGFLTQSRDGKPVAPLMGDFKEYDGGYTSGRIYPANYAIACSDHALIPRFTPLGPTRTEVEMIWLVRPDAVEGRDYDVAKLTWLWKVTTDQDKTLVDNNQAGVNSMAYRPGPYAKTEQGLTRFTTWYLAEIA